MSPCKMGRHLCEAQASISACTRPAPGASTRRWGSWPGKRRPSAPSGQRRSRPRPLAARTSGPGWSRRPASGACCRCVAGCWLLDCGLNQAASLVRDRASFSELLPYLISWLAGARPYLLACQTVHSTLCVLPRSILQIDAKQASKQGGMHDQPGTKPRRSNFHTYLAPTHPRTAPALCRPRLPCRHRPRQPSPAA
jgi:hypothetical protein